MENKDFEMPKGKANEQILVVPIIDASGSMTENGNIGKVNEAMREVAGQLKKVEEDEDVEVLLAPIIFNSDAIWPLPKPVRPNEFVWYDVQASGGTNLGKAYTILSEKLTSKENGGWLDGYKGLAPILLLISDGAPNVGWETGFSTLKQKTWFAKSLRYAIAVEGADRSVLAQFTESTELIFDTEKLRVDLGTIIQKIIYTATIGVSKGTEGKMNPDLPDADKEQRENINKEVVAEVNNIDKNGDDIFFHKQTL